LAAKIEGLPEAGRMNAIRGMVEGLAARLAQNGQDLANEDAPSGP
jgi:cytochrome c-type biogenesis protein CcmH